MKESSLDRLVFVPAVMAGLFISRSFAMVGTWIARGWPLQTVHWSPVFWWSLWLGLAVCLVYLSLEKRIGRPVLWIPVITYLFSLIASVAQIPFATPSYWFVVGVQAIGSAPLWALGGFLGVLTALLIERTRSAKAS